MVALYIKDHEDLHLIDKKYHPKTSFAIGIIKQKCL